MCVNDCDEWKNRKSNKSKCNWSVKTLKLKLCANFQGVKVNK